MPERVSDDSAQVNVYELDIETLREYLLRRDRELRDARARIREVEEDIEDLLCLAEQVLNGQGLKAPVAALRNGVKVLKPKYHEQEIDI